VNPSQRNAAEVCGVLSCGARLRLCAIMETGWGFKRERGRKGGYGLQYALNTIWGDQTVDGLMETLTLPGKPHLTHLPSGTCIQYSPTIPPTRSLGKPSFPPRLSDRNSNSPCSSGFRRYLFPSLANASMAYSIPNAVAKSGLLPSSYCWHWKMRNCCKPCWF
jgi:hypothetical protein